MRSMTDRASLWRAIMDPRLSPAVRRLLALRRRQTGGRGAHYYLLSPADGPEAAEAAVGWPLTDDGEPCWDAALAHDGGLVELVFVLSDDGPAQVVIVPADADPAVLELVRRHA